MTSFWQHRRIYQTLLRLFPRSDILRKPHTYQSPIQLSISASPNGRKYPFFTTASPSVSIESSRSTNVYVSKDASYWCGDGKEPRTGVAEEHNFDGDTLERAMKAIEVEGRTASGRGFRYPRGVLGDKWPAPAKGKMLERPIDINGVLWNKEKGASNGPGPYRVVYIAERTDTEPIYTFVGMFWHYPRPEGDTASIMPVKKAEVVVPNSLKSKRSHKGQDALECEVGRLLGSFLLERIGLLQYGRTNGARSGLESILMMELLNLVIITYTVYVINMRRKPAVES